jgi:hypothetical protein
MRQLEDLVQFENANSGLAFRERLYGSNERADLLRDLMGLANASVQGPRYLVLGVSDVVGGKRKIVGLPAEQWNKWRAKLPSLIGGMTEPPLDVAVRTLELQGSVVGVLCLTACADQPYLMSGRAGTDLPAGSGCLRRGTQLFPLLRQDLQRMFEAKLARAVPPVDLKIGFGGGNEPRAAIALPVLRLKHLPSFVAAKKFHKILEAKRDARSVGRTQTRLMRLVHAQVFGVERPYESHSDDSLRMQIEKSKEDYRPADEHYAFEVRAHRLDIVVYNPGSVALDNATIRMTLPRIDGAGVAERLYAPPDGQAPSEGYPRVKTSGRTVSIEAEIGSLPAGNTVSVFEHPPRFWARSAAAGKTIPVVVTLQARELRDPVRETLTIRIVDAAKPSRKNRG